MKSVVTAGFLSLLAGATAVYASDNLAADASRVDVIGTVNEATAQVDSNKAGSKSMRVDVIESSGHEGPVYPYTEPMNR